MVRRRHPLHSQHIVNPTKFSEGSPLFTVRQTHSKWGAPALSLVVHEVFGRAAMATLSSPAIVRPRQLVA